MRRALISVVLLTVGAVPILIGTACPPPRQPAILGVVPPPNGATRIVVPNCTTGFVCVNLANSTSVPVRMALYLHNGYDPNNQFALTPDFACCTNPNSTVACTCPCPGRDTGNCRLNFMQLFIPTNVRPIGGQDQVTLAPNQAVFQQIRCEQIKTVGASLAPADGNAIDAPIDQDGPVYRGEPGGVGCGQTVQFQAVNQNTTSAGNSGQDLATLIISRQFSQ